MVLNNITKAVAGVAGASAVVKAVSGDKPLGSISTFLASNPGALDNLTKATVFKKQHLNDKGEATPNAITTAWNNISSSAKTAYNNITKNNLQTHSKKWERGLDITTNLPITTKNTQEKVAKFLTNIIQHL